MFQFEINFDDTLSYICLVLMLVLSEILIFSCGDCGNVIAFFFFFFNKNSQKRPMNNFISLLCVTLVSL
jgi:hypothetical protein